MVITGSEESLAFQTGMKGYKYKLALILPAERKQMVGLKAFPYCGLLVLTFETYGHNEGLGFPPPKLCRGGG